MPGFIIRRTVTKTPPTDTASLPVRTRRVLQPAAQLESWVDRPWTDGVQVDTLRDLDVLFVKTLNTVYHITVRQTSGADTGVSVSVDGVVQSDPTILLLDDRREHQAEVHLQTMRDVCDDEQNRLSSASTLHISTQGEAQ